MFTKSKNKTAGPYLVFGLGNPGRLYSGTPHNVGWDFLEYLRHNAGPAFSWKKQSSLQAETLTIPWIGEKLLLLRSLRFMNESGLTLKKVKDFYKIPAGKIIIIHDDSDLNLGKVKLANSESRSAGHHGVDSIFTQLKTRAISRIKTGVRPQNSRAKADSFILKKFTAEQKKITLQEIFPLLEKILTTLIKKSQDNS